MIKLTEKQKRGLKITIDRYKKGERYTCIAGYAGTGKSTLVSYIVKELNFDNNYDEIAYCCYTGKASLILQLKGLPATTAHRLLYKSKELPDGTFLHIPRLTPDNPNLKIVIVDEVSMLEKEMWSILMSWKGVYVICLGDPEQLPPLHEPNGILDNPHVFLDEIMRQALDNEIIKLSMDIREGKFIPNQYSGKDIQIAPKSYINEEILLSANQVICGKNKTRFDLNMYMRQAIWKNKYQDLPLQGDKIICLENYCEYDLINGEIGIINNKPKNKNLPYFENNIIQCNFKTDYSLTKNLNMDKNIFLTGEPTDYPYWIRLKFDKCNRPLKFDYGYAITCHKAQGSQWDNIIIYDEYLGDKEFHRRWLYTAVTRACKKLILFKQ